MPRCAICNSAGTRACARCKSISYCSEECQERDWSTHKLLCAQLHSQPPRPNPSYRSAILLRPEAKTPQLVWVRCTTMENDPYYGAWELNDGVDTLMLSSEPADNYSGVARVPFQHNVVRKRELDHTIEASFRDNFLNDGSTRNQVVAAVTRGRAAHDWRGPIVCMRKREVGIDARTYEDVTLEDFRDIVDYLISYNNPLFDVSDSGHTVPDMDRLTDTAVVDGGINEEMAPPLAQPPPAPPPNTRPEWRRRLDELKQQQADIEQRILHPRQPSHDEMIEWIRDIKQMQALSAPKLLNSTLTKRRLKSVRVNCVGDLHFDKGKFVQVEMPGGHPFFEDGFQASPISPVSKLVGFPVRGKRQPRYPDSDNTPESYDNVAITHLFTEMDPESPHWGFSLSRLYWGYQVGSIVLMRDDGEDLTAAQAAALCNFCQVVVGPLLEKALVASASRESVMDLVTPQLFEQTAALVRDQQSQIENLLASYQQQHQQQQQQQKASEEEEGGNKRPVQSLWASRKDSKFDAVAGPSSSSASPFSASASPFATATTPNPLDDMPIFQTTADVERLAAATPTTTAAKLKKANRNPNLIAAVRINCPADMAASATSPYTQTTIPLNHPALSENTPSASLARVYGLPLRAWKCHPPPHLAPPSPGADNAVVARLFAECDDPAHNPFWGCAPPAWRSGVGSVLLVREDGGDLGVAEVERLVAWVEGVCGALFEEALAGRRGREEVLGVMREKGLIGGGGGGGGGGEKGEGGSGSGSGREEVMGGI